MDSNLRGFRGLDEKEDRGERRNGLDVWQVLDILWRRKIMIVAAMIVAVLIAAVFLIVVNPRYEARLQIVFEGTNGSVFNVNDHDRDHPKDESAIMAELQVVKSRNLAQRVIDNLGLDQQPEFNNPGNAFAKLLRESFSNWLLSFIPTEAVELPAEYAKQRVVDNFLKSLEAYQIGRSRAIEVRFTSRRPKLAAKALNALAEYYVLARLESRFENAQRASTWLVAHLQKLGQQVEDSENAIEDYRKAHNLFEGSQGSLVAEQISGLSAKLTDAAAMRAVAEANLAQARQLLRSKGDIGTVSEVLKSELIRSFRQQEVDLQRREAEMRTQLGSYHPAMVQLQAEKERLHERVRDEINRITTGLENQVQVEQAREAVTAKDLQALKNQLAAFDAASVELHALERDAAAKRMLLEKFVAAHNEAGAAADVRAQLSEAFIVSPAPIPEDPSFPNKKMVIVTALLVGSMVGMLIVFVQEHRDSSFRSGQQIEHSTGIVVLSHIPLLSAVKENEDGVTEYVINRPHSAFSEGVRSIYTRLVLGNNDIVPKVLLLTSSDVGEGKSTLALSMARQQAQVGSSVLLVDADFRRSKLAMSAQLAATRGLSEALAGAAKIADVIQRDKKSTVDLVLAGSPPLESVDTLNYPKWEALFGSLYDRYDLILIDSPPVLALTDATILANIADATILVVRWGRTRRQIVHHALDRINKFGGSVTGIVLSMVDLRRSSRYAYTDSVYYQGNFAQYFKE